MAVFSHSPAVLERQIAETVSRIDEQDRVIAKNEAKLQELQAAVDTLTDQLEVKRTKYRDVRAAHSDMEQRLHQVNIAWQDRHRGQELQERNETLRETYEQIHSQALDKQREKRQLESEVMQLQVEYEQERQHRLELSRKLSTACNDVASYIQKRSEDGMSERREPLRALKRLKEIERERERDLQNSVRELREIQSIVEMKTRRVKEVEEESAKEVSIAVAAKDDDVAKLRAMIGAERHKIEEEIAQLEHANAEQAYNLKRGGGEGLQVTDEDDADKSPTQRLLESKNRELARRKQQLKEQSAKLTKERNDKVKGTRLEKQKFEKEKRQWDLELRRLDREYQSVKADQTKLREENRRLEEQAESLASALQSSMVAYKKQRERYKAHTRDDEEERRRPPRPVARGSSGPHPGADDTRHPMDSFEYADSDGEMF